jgi:hypothetical protein
VAILGENLDYTDRDFDALRARLFALVLSVFPTWTSQQVANFGNLLVELYAFVGDVLGKYQDNQARESRWTQATQRKNLIALAKLIGYEPATATASQVTVALSIPAAAAGDVTIPAGTVVRTRETTDPVIFRLLADAVIEAGQTAVTATAENSEPEDDVSASSGLPTQELILSQVPYLDGSASITAGNGAYAEVDNFLNSDSTDRHFTVGVDQNDRATVRFGDGVAGAIPTGTITASYKTGGGADGQVEAGTVTVAEGVFTDEFGAVVQLSTTNPSASTPATDRETVEQIRVNAPLSIRAVNRTVSREDYEINALRIPQVARALMLTSNEDVGIGENQGTLYVVPVGGGSPTQDLKDDVLEQVTVTFPNTLTFLVTVSDPVFKAVDVTATIHIRKGFSGAAVKSAIVSALQTFFSPTLSDGTANPDIGFGLAFVEEEGDPVGLLPLSDVFNVVRDVAGVRKVGDTTADFNLNGAHSDVELQLREFPTLGTVVVIDAATGTPL